MLSVNIQESEVSGYLRGIPQLSDTHGVNIARVNSPKNVTLSGNESDIDAIYRYMDDKGTFARKVPTGVAYHSPRMLIVADQYAKLIHDLEMGKAPTRPAIMISSATGQKDSGYKSA